MMGASDTGQLTTARVDNAAASSHRLLVALLENVKLQGYKFITVTPLTHERFLARNLAPGKNLRDIFGWNSPFAMEVLSPLLQSLVTEANVISPCGEHVKTKLRISSLGHDVFLHSAFPTSEADAVFFGPDTYRFVRFIRQQIEIFSASFITSKNPIRILDIGCGTGAGGIAAVRALPKGMAYELTMNDINSVAIDYMLVNAQVAEVPVRLLPGDIFEKLQAQFDIIVANPPFMSDAVGRSYRDGGGRLGLDLSLRILKASFAHLAPGGKLLLYTGVAMTGQSDPFLTNISPLLANANCTWSYEEIDPDIFGEELDQSAYASAHRIAAVGLVVTRGQG